jgi:hypothetical protein
MSIVPRWCLISQKWFEMRLCAFHLQRVSLRRVTRAIIGNVCLPVETEQVPVIVEAWMESSSEVLSFDVNCDARTARVKLGGYRGSNLKSCD